MAYNNNIYNTRLQIDLKHRFFSLDELYASAVARREGILNIPPASAQHNMHLLIHYLLDPIRSAWQDVIHVTSGYRCPTLNRLVGGSETSHHQLGLAADIVPRHSASKDEVRALWNCITRLASQKDLPICQLIAEDDFSHIHISLDKEFLVGAKSAPRRQYIIR